jgi:hypothetical protein
MIGKCSPVAGIGFVIGFVIGFAIGIAGRAISWRGETNNNPPIPDIILKKVRRLVW